MVTITVPQEKAKQLQALSILSVESLNILEKKAKQSPAKVQELEKKLKQYAFLM